MNVYRNLRAAVAFAGVALRALFRDRVVLFFVLALPVAVIVVVGTTFGSISKVRVGVVDDARDAVSERVLDGLEAGDGLDVRHYDSVDELRKAVRRYGVDIGIVLPPGLAESVQSGGSARLPQYQLAASQASVASATAVRGVVDRVNATVTAAQFASGGPGTTFATALAAVDGIAASGSAGGTVVERVDVGERFAATASEFALTASQQLVLFTFVNALAAGAFIVTIRRDGVLRRSLSAPVTAGAVVLGIGIGWFLLAVIQSLFIVGVGAIVFGVDWGDPVAAAALIVAFSSVSCGAGLLVGAYGSDGDKVGAITPVIGIVLGALGGCMVPLEGFPAFMRALAHVTPHYWAVDAWQKLVFDGASVGRIAGSLAVLVAAAVALTAVAAQKLRRDLTLS